MEKGIETLEEPHNSLGGFITLCMVDLSLLLVCLDNMSPTFIINSSSSAIASIHLPYDFELEVLDLAPINSVIKLMSPWAAV